MDATKFIKIWPALKGKPLKLTLGSKLCKDRRGDRYPG